MRAMAGLSMGSLQTSITGFDHPGYFSSLGIFSGFVSDMIQGSPLDMVQREVSKNEHMKILDDADMFISVPWGIRIPFGSILTTMIRS